jgi:hypothetical protein
MKSRQVVEGTWNYMEQDEEQEKDQNDASKLTLKLV